MKAFCVAIFNSIGKFFASCLDKLDGTRQVNREMKGVLLELKNAKEEAARSNTLLTQLLSKPQPAPFDLAAVAQAVAAQVQLRNAAEMPQGAAANPPPTNLNEAQIREIVGAVHSEKMAELVEAVKTEVMILQNQPGALNELAKANVVQDLKKLEKAMGDGFKQIKSDQDLLGKNLSSMDQRVQTFGEQQAQLEKAMGSGFKQIKSDQDLLGKNLSSMDLRVQTFGEQQTQLEEAMGSGFKQIKSDQDLLGKNLSSMDQRVQTLGKQQTQLKTSMSAGFTQVKGDVQNLLGEELYHQWVSVCRRWKNNKRS